MSLAKQARSMVNWESEGSGIQNNKPGCIDAWEVNCWDSPLSDFVLSPESDAVTFWCASSRSVGAA
jgi:hypothetical protein